jgi:hypothetical protein
MVDLVGAAWPLPAAVPMLPRVKVALTTTSLKACRVAMSSNSLVVFGYSRPSSRTKEQHVVPSQNAEMTSVWATLGSS